MPLPPSAPYDPLSTVTSLVRTILADYIRGLNPAPQSVVNTNGTAVTWVSGAKFTLYYRNTVLSINGMQFPVASVNSLTSITLGTAAAVQNGVPCIAAIPTGDIFADSEAYVVPTVNLAWRKLQRKLADKGHPRLEREGDVLGLPVVTSLDPLSQQWINWTGFFDGTSQQTSPTLPPDFISPLRLWERISSPAPNFTRPWPMRPAPNALWSRVKGSRNRYFDWREDAIYFPGAILSLDLRVRYAAFLPDLAVASGGFGSTPVPIMRCADSLAYYTAATFVAARGGQAIAPDFEAKGDAAVDQITNSFAKLQQRASFSRIPWGARGRRMRA